MRRVLLKESGFGVDCPFLVQDRQGKVWAILVTQGDKPSFDNGSIVVHDLSGSQPPLTVTTRPGIYSSASGVFDSRGNLWIAFSEFNDGNRRICLAGVSPSAEVSGPVEISNGFGKYDSPTLALHEGELWVVWESYESGGCHIASRRTSVASTLRFSEPQAITPIGERACRPTLASAGGELYLIYESYSDGRYRLMAKVFGKSVSQSVEIGFPDGNDLSPSVCEHSGRLIVAWDNSSPLSKGYVYHRFPEITIPAFGHGWRVDGRIGLARIAYEDGKWSIDFIDRTDGRSHEVAIEAAESSGCPKIFTNDNGCLFLAFLSCNQSQHGWQVEAYTCEGDVWRQIETIDCGSPIRITPSAIYSAEHGSVLIGHIFNSPEDRGFLVESVDVDDIKNKPVPFVSTTARPKCEESNEARPGVDYEGKSLKLWWGDLHMHSNISSCSLHPGFHCSEIEEKYRFSRDVGGLDFAMVTDHDNMDEFDWARTRRAGAFHNMPGEFVSFTGFEWTSSMMTDHPNFGHENVLFLEDDAPLYGRRDMESDTPDKLWAKLRGRNCITIPHHPSDEAHPVDWSYHDPDLRPLVEIFQVRGSYEYDGCPANPLNYGRKVVPGRSVRNALNMGYQLGFTAGGEHEGVGVTAVFAEELTRESIFAALKARRTYACTGARIFLDFRVNGRMMGEVIPACDHARISIKAGGADRISSIRLVRNGEDVREWKDLGSEVEMEWDDPNIRLPGYYYVVITQMDGEMAWSSPVFWEQASRSMPTLAIMA
ncbi:MAG: CehA/McbA family metallohydrolase [Armatimonadota bacterium]|nr:CehA/McbA family metallohydrolase [Armatimonadota bacterium]